MGFLKDCAKAMALVFVNSFLCLIDKKEGITRLEVVSGLIWLSVILALPLYIPSIRIVAFVAMIVLASLLVYARAKTVYKDWRIASIPFAAVVVTFIAFILCYLFTKDQVDFLANAGLLQTVASEITATNVITSILSIVFLLANIAFIQGLFYLLIVSDKEYASSYRNIKISKKLYAIAPIVAAASLIIVTLIYFVSMAIIVNNERAIETSMTKEVPGKTLVITNGSFMPDVSGSYQQLADMYNNNTSELYKYFEGGVDDKFKVGENVYAVVCISHNTSDGNPLIELGIINTGEQTNITIDNCKVNDKNYDIGKEFELKNGLNFISLTPDTGKLNGGEIFECTIGNNVVRSYLKLQK